MSLTITKNTTARRESSHSGREVTPERVDADLSSRQHFYESYRDAVRALRRGEPQRFLDYQNDPRIKPSPESLSLPVRPKPEGTTNSLITTQSRALEESQFTIISLLASIRSLVTTVANLIPRTSREDTA